MGEFGSGGICLGAFRDKMEYSNSVSRRKTILLHVDQQLYLKFISRNLSLIYMH